MPQLPGPLRQIVQTWCIKYLQVIVSSFLIVDISKLQGLLQASNQLFPRYVLRDKILAEVALAIPVSSVAAEHGFSRKTK